MNIKEKIWSTGLKRYDTCVQQMINGENTEKIIDLGCGDGNFTREIISKFKFSEINGVENNSEKIKQAEANGLKTYCCDLNQTLPFCNDSFDLILSHFVIEHLFNVDNFVMEIRRILKKDGCAIIGTENLASLHNLVALFIGMQPFPMSIALSSKYCLGNSLQKKNMELMDKDGSPHVRVFAYQGLIDIFRIYSFEVEEIKGAGYIPFSGWFSHFFASIDPRHAAFILIKVRKPELIN